MVTYDRTLVSRLGEALRETGIEKAYNEHVRHSTMKMQRPMNLSLFAKTRDRNETRFSFVPSEWYDDYDRRVLQAARLNPRNRARTETFYAFVKRMGGVGCHLTSGAEDFRLREDYLEPLERLSVNDASYAKRITLNGKRKLLSMGDWAREQTRRNVFLQDVQHGELLPTGADPRKKRLGTSALGRKATEEEKEELRGFRRDFDLLVVPAIDSRGDEGGWPEYAPDRDDEDREAEEGEPAYAAVPLKDLLREPGRYQVRPDWQEVVRGFAQGAEELVVYDTQEGRTTSLLSVLRSGEPIERYRLLREEDVEIEETPKLRIKDRDVVFRDLSKHGVDKAALQMRSVGLDIPLSVFLSVSASTDAVKYYDPTSGVAFLVRSRDASKFESLARETGYEDAVPADRLQIVQGDYEEEEEEDEAEDEEEEEEEEQEQETQPQEEEAEPKARETPSDFLMCLRRNGDDRVVTLRRSRFGAEGESRKDWARVSLKVYIEGVEGHEFFRGKGSAPLPTRASVWSRVKQFATGRVILPEIGEFPGPGRTWEGFFRLFEDVYTPLGFDHGRRFAGESGKRPSPDERIAELGEDDRIFLLRGLILMAKVISDKIVNVHPGPFDFGAEIRRLNLNVENPGSRRAMVAACRAVGDRCMGHHDDRVFYPSAKRDARTGESGGKDVDREGDEKEPAGDRGEKEREQRVLEEAYAKRAPDDPSPRPFSEVIRERKLKAMRDRYVRGRLADPASDSAASYLSTLPTGALGKRMRESIDEGVGEDVLDRLESAGTPLPLLPEEDEESRENDPAAEEAEDAELAKELLADDRVSHAFWDRLVSDEPEELYDEVYIEWEGQGNVKVFKPLLVLCPRGPKVDVDALLDDWRSYVFPLSQEDKVVFIRSSMFSVLGGHRTSSGKGLSKKRGKIELLLKNLNGDLVNLYALSLRDKENTLKRFVDYVKSTLAYTFDETNPVPYLLPVWDSLEGSGAVFSDFQNGFGIVPVADYLRFPPGKGEVLDDEPSKLFLSSVLERNEEELGVTKTGIKPTLVLLPSPSLLKKYKGLRKNWRSFFFPFSRADRELFMRAFVVSNRRGDDSSAWYIKNMSGHLVDLQSVRYSNLETFSRLFNDVLFKRWTDEVEKRVRPFVVFVDDVHEILNVSAPAP